MTRILPSSLKSAIQAGVAQAADLARVPVRRTVDLRPLSANQVGRIREYFSRPKFFLIGYPRSGTTLLARLLSVHPIIHCDWQAHFVTEFSNLVQVAATVELENWASRANNRWTRGSESVTSLLRVLADFVMESKASEEGAEIVGDKSPADHWSSSLINLKRIYPDARVIHIVRDGRDVALSRRVQQFVDRPEALDAYGRSVRKALRREGQCPHLKSRSIFGASWLREEARKWNREASMVKAAGSELYGADFVNVRFEDLLSDPVETVRTLWGFLAEDEWSGDEGDILQVMEENPAADWHESAAPTLVSGFPRGKAGGWEAVFTPEDREIYGVLAAEGLGTWGYEGPDR